MKKLVAIILAVALFTFSLSSPALAGDAAAGEAVFKANCIACHKGGKNTINPTKTLSIADLEKNGKDSVEAIIKQVTNGAGAMPNFKRLGEEKIANVAAYVYEQAKAGW